MTDNLDLAQENAALRGRIQALETELAMLTERTAKTVAQAQETLYWFERWGVDFNRLFARREMEYLRRAVRVVRQGYRTALKAKRRLVA